MSNYFISKLSEINYNMAIDEGGSSYRLASQARKILVQLCVDKQSIPSKHKKTFDDLTFDIKITIENLISSGLTPIRIYGITNKKASKYIKMLIDMEYDLMQDNFYE